MNVLELNDANPESECGNDLLGIEAWSTSRGIAASSGMVVAATILSTVAANSVSFGLSLPFRSSAAACLGIRDTDTHLRMAVGELLEQLVARQDGLVRRSNGFSITELESAYHEGGFQSRNQEFLESIGNPTGHSNFGVAVDGMLDRDSYGCLQTIEVENLLRPRFLTRGSLRGDPCKLASGFHEGQALAACLSIPLSKKGVARDKEIDALLEAVRGLDLPRRLTSRTNPVLESVSLRGIFQFEGGDFNGLARDRRDFVGLVVPLVSEAVETSIEVDEGAAASFVNRFRRVADLALACRRGRANCEGNFFDPKSDGEFLRLQRGFLGEMQTHPENFRLPAIDSLPARIAWTLLVLAGRENIDDYVLHVSFDAAREIHARAITFLEFAENESLARTRLKNARKMAARVQRLGSCSRRELLRGFDQQSLDLHEPVILSLIAAGVFCETPDGRLVPGVVPVEQLSPGNVIHFNQPLKCTV